MAYRIMTQLREATRSWPVNSERMVVGRSETCDVSLDDDLLSRRHVIITRSEDTFFIEDLGSRNGTVLGGVEIVARVRTPLPLGKIVHLGSNQIQIWVEKVNDSAEAKPAPPARNPAQSLPNETPEFLKQVFLQHKTLSEQIESLHKDIALLKKQKVDHEQASRKAEARFEELFQELAPFEELLLAKSKERDELVEQKRAIHEKKRNLETEVDALNLVKQEQRKSIDHLKSEVDQQNQKLEERKQWLKEQLDKIVLGHHADVQEKSRIHQENLRSLEAELEAFQNRLTEKEQELLRTQSLVERIASQRTAIQEDVATLRIQKSEIQDENKSLQYQVDHITKQRDDLGKAIQTLSEELGSLESRRDELGKNIQENTSELKTLVDSLVLIKKDILEAEALLAQRKHQAEHWATLTESARKRNTDEETRLQALKSQIREADEALLSTVSRSRTEEKKLLELEAGLLSFEARKKLLFDQVQSTERDLLLLEQNKVIAEQKAASARSEQKVQEELLAQAQARTHQREQELRGTVNELEARRNVLQDEIHDRLSRCQSEIEALRQTENKQIQWLRQKTLAELDERHANLDREWKQKGRQLEKSWLDSQKEREQNWQAVYNEKLLRAESELSHRRHDLEQEFRNMQRERESQIQQQKDRECIAVIQVLHWWFRKESIEQRRDFGEGSLIALEEVLNRVLREGVTDASLLQAMPLPQNIHWYQRYSRQQLGLAGFVFLVFLFGGVWAGLRSQPLGKEATGLQQGSVTESWGLSGTEVGVNSMNSTSRGPASVSQSLNINRTSHFRDNYAENIIYMEQYLEHKTNPRVKDRWAIHVHRFLSETIKLTARQGDRRTGELLAAEDAMIRDMQHILRTTSQQHFDRDFGRMRVVEEASTSKIRELLENDLNYAKFRRLEKDFMREQLKQ